MPTAVIASFAVCGASFAQAVSFIAQPGSWATEASCISADGRTIAGTWVNNDTFEYTAWRWTAETGRVDHAPVDYIGPARISGDGSVIAGTVFRNGRDRAARWSGPGTLQELGSVGRLTYSISTAMSRDGSVIAGTLSSNQNPGPAPFVWTAATGMQSMGNVPGASSYSTPVAVSNDGSTIVGSSISNDMLGWRWRRDIGYEFLPTLDRPGVRGADPTAANGDCSIIVGNAGNVGIALMWSDVGVTELGIMRPTAVDDAGSIVVGTLGGGSTMTAMIWTASTGVVKLT